MSLPGRSARITGTSDDGSVSAQPCRLLAVVIGKAVASNTVTLYDDASGGTTNPIVAIDTTVARDFHFGPEGRVCSNGLSAIVSGGTQDIAVIYA